MKSIHMVAFILLIVGGLNWLLVGVFGYNLVDSIFGPMTIITRAIYVLVGLSAVAEIVNHKKLCRMCNPGGQAMTK